MHTVMQFHNHLLGEMEQLASLSPVRNGVVASSPSGRTGLTPNPKAKSLQAQGQDPNGKPPKAKTPRMFFGKRDTGCSTGRKRPYLHSWDGVPDKPSRCREKIAQQRSPHSRRRLALLGTWLPFQAPSRSRASRSPRSINPLTRLRESLRNAA